MFSVVARPIITSLLLDSSFLVFHYLISLLKCVPRTASLSFSLGKTKPSSSVQGCTSSSYNSITLATIFCVLNIPNHSRTFKRVTTTMFLSFHLPSQRRNCTRTSLRSSPLYPELMNRLGWRNEQSRESERADEYCWGEWKSALKSVMLSPGQQHTVQTHKRSGANKQMPT